MHATIRSFLGTENFVERFEVRMADGRKAELRWADCDRSILADASTRMRDAADFLVKHPHPVAPEVYGTVSTRDGVGILVSPFPGPALDALCDEPLELEVALEISSLLADYLIHLASLRDTLHRPFEVSLRNLSLETVHLGADASVRISGVETLGGDWPSRVVRTTHLERSRDTRLSMLGKGPADDIYDLGCIILALVAGQAVARDLDDALNKALDGTLHDKAVHDALSPRRVSAPHSLLALLKRMLSFYPDERPDPIEVRASVFELFASPVALETYAREVCGGWRYVPGGRHPMIGQRFPLDGGIDALPDMRPTEELPTEEAGPRGASARSLHSGPPAEARPTPGKPAWATLHEPRPSVGDSASDTARRLSKRRQEARVAEPETMLGIVRLRPRSSAERRAARLQAADRQALDEETVPRRIPLQHAPIPPSIQIPARPRPQRRRPRRRVAMLIAGPILGALIGMLLGLASIALVGVLAFFIQLVT